MYSDEIKARARETLFKNGTAPSSQQQRYLCKVFGGSLNYASENTGAFSLDIAFPDEMIYIEYNGSGHSLQVKYGVMTEEELKHKDYVRSQILQRQGWRLFLIESLTDRLPKKDMLLREFNNAKEKFAKGEWYYKMIINHKDKTKPYGKLRIYR